MTNILTCEILFKTILTEQNNVVKETTDIFKAKGGRPHPDLGGEKFKAKEGHTPAETKDLTN